MKCRRGFSKAFRARERGVGEIAGEPPALLVRSLNVSAVGDIVEDLVDLQIADRESRSPAVKERLRRLTDRRLRSRHGLSKAEAARMLDISVNTLDKWIARGRVAVVRADSSRRTLVAIVPFARLLREVREIRALGETSGVLATAIAQLERDDPTTSTSSPSSMARASRQCRTVA